jgi:hypothetical protein
MVLLAPLIWAKEKRILLGMAIIPVLKAPNTMSYVANKVMVSQNSKLKIMMQGTWLINSNLLTRLQN